MSRKADGESNAMELAGLKFINDMLKDYDYQQAKKAEIEAEQKEKATKKIQLDNRRTIETHLVSTDIPDMMIFYQETDEFAATCIRRLYNTPPVAFRFCMPNGRMLYAVLTPKILWYVVPLQRTGIGDDGSGEYEPMKSTYVPCESLGQALKFVHLNECDQTAEKLKNI